MDYKLVWRRLHSVAVNPGGGDVLFLLVHNKLPVPERLFRIGVRNDPYCLHCPGAEMADIDIVWNFVYIGRSELKLEKFFGFLKLKYKNS